MVIDGSNLGASENRSEPRASCVNDIYAISNSVLLQG